MAERSLVFRAGPLLCAMPISQIVETMRPLAVQPLAGTPAFVQGLSVLRGVPVPVVDVAHLVGGASGEVSRFVAVRTERSVVAFAIGTVIGVRTVVPDSDTEHHHRRPPGPASVVIGIGSIDLEPLLFLDGGGVFSDRDWSAVSAAPDIP